jgi:CrcB protein
MTELLAVGIGGFIGAILRYLVSSWVQQSFSQGNFPIGTLAVNLIGCLIIGLLGGLNETRMIFSPHARMLIFLGILGSFTTFSSFGYETMALVRESQFLLAAGNIALQLFLGLLAFWYCYAIATCLH